MPDLAIDAAAREVTVAGRRVKLGGRALDVLIALAARPGLLCSNAELMAAVWPHRVVEETNLRVQITALRKALGAALIVSVPGRGYILARSVIRVVSLLHPPRLPSWEDSLLGREAELTALTELQRSHRLITVLGSGGIGKTRLAHQLAVQQQAKLSDSVGWVDLSALTSATQICPAIAAACHVQAEGLEREGAAQRLGHALAARASWVVLDSAEHLAHSLAGIAHTLLAAAPLLRLLVTSQQPLRVPYEQVFRLDPLAVPAEDATAEEARRSPALQLLERRARTADHRFAFSDAALRDAGALCRQLDGIALALDMAGARLPLFGAGELLRRLGERLALLGQVSDIGARRHQTLRAALDWSHGLLAPEEQAVLRCLSVFAAAFRLDSAQRVAAHAGIDESAALRAIAALADKSLLQVQGGEPRRYRLLETTRLYAAQGLAQHGEQASAEQRHVAALAVIADQAQAGFWHESDRQWLAQWQADHAEALVAFDRACASGDAESAAPISEALHHWAALSGNFSDLRQRLPAALALVPLASVRGRALLLGRVGIGAVPGVSRLEAARQRVAAWRAFGERAGLCRALAHLAIVSEWAGDSAQADAALAEAAALDDPGWPPRQRAMGAVFAAPRIAARRGDSLALHKYSLELLVLAESAGATRLAAQARFDVGVAYQLGGRPQVAVAHMDRALAEFKALGLGVDLGVAMGVQCSALLATGDLARTRDTAVQALRLSASDDDAPRFMVDALALLACRLERPDDAAHMLGAADALRERLTLPRNAIDAALAADAQAWLQSKLDPARLATRIAAGRGLVGAALREAALKWLAPAR